MKENRQQPPERYEEIKKIIHDFLGKVESLPMIFDPICLCPECLWTGMVVHGCRWECPKCGFTCHATIKVNLTGLKWLNLLRAIGDS